MIRPSGEQLRSRIGREEFDYQTLLDSLQEYSRPRDKISSLIRRGVIIRVKKGLYVFGDGFRKRPFSRELLANLIYGPSYVSLEFALQAHGLIPERVQTVTSVAVGRSRAFLTPIGRFSYRRIPMRAFPAGMSRVEGEGGVAYLIAVPEKALSDYLAADRGGRLQSEKEMGAYLLNSLRLDPNGLARLDARLVEEIAHLYRSKKIHVLARYLRRQERSRKEFRHA